MLDAFQNKAVPLKQIMTEWTYCPTDPDTSSASMCSIWSPDRLVSLYVMSQTLLEALGLWN